MTPIGRWGTLGLLLAGVSLSSTTSAQTVAPPRRPGTTAPFGTNPVPGTSGPTGKTAPKGPIVQPTPKPVTGNPSSKGIVAKGNTHLTVELVTGAEGVGLKAARWAPIFDRLGVTLTIRRADANDQVGVTETVSPAGNRDVRVIGKLEKDGRVIMGNQSFTEADEGKISAWFKELRSFGAQGSPAGQAVWGLSKSQFEELHVALSQPLPRDLQGLDFRVAIAAVKLPPQYALRITPEAKLHVDARRGESKVSQSLEGLSGGTALAALLNEQGLGFIPLRKPEGSLELAIVPLDSKIRVWPVGWPADKVVPPARVVPKLYAMVDIELDELELSDVLAALAEQTGVPVLEDRHALEAKGIDFSQVKVSHPRKKTMWSLVLKAITFQAKAKPEVVLDEANKPFVWITPLTAASPSKTNK